MEWYENEPVIHSHVTDGLDESHPLAWKCVYCDKCEEMLHCSNNECMQTWIEWGPRALCGECFAPFFLVGVISAQEVFPGEFGK